MTDVEAVDDVTREALNHLEAAVVNGTAVVENKDQVDTEALEAALFQLVSCFDEVIHVAGVAVVLLPEVDLSFDVTRDVDTVVLIVRIK